MSAEIVCLPENLDLRTLSHELRTPLVPILAFTHELLETELTSEQKNLVNDILEAGNQLLKLANKLLEIKKLATNVNFNIAELEALLCFLLKQMQPKNAIQKIKIRY